MRADTFGYLQRSFAGLASEVDAKEARAVGKFAASEALKGKVRHGSISIVRKKKGEYSVSYAVTELAKVAKLTRPLEDRYVQGDNDIAPEFLVLDEPLGALDLPLRRRILPYLIRVRAAFDLPMLVVSHDATEIQALCEEVAVLERGRVVACGPPERVLRGRAAGGYENVLAGIALDVLPGTARVGIAPGIEVQVPAGSLRVGDQIGRAHV